MDIEQAIEQAHKRNLLPEAQKTQLLQLYHAYRSHADTKEICSSIFTILLEKVLHHLSHPFLFSPYHRQITHPFNYYQFGLDFLRPLVDLPHSTVQGTNQLDVIQKKIAQGENIIFLANHQIEADPQAISLLLENQYPHIAQDMIFVAGERVILDPVAVPFSMGRNLLCIYSKRHINHPPALKAQKLLHNTKTLERMSQLLSEGGHTIYVAPSGGRDRPDPTGSVAVAAFDAQSIELFYLMTKKATKPTSFYPMALSTYHILPPPDTIEKELGERRTAGRGAIHLWIGSQIDMDTFPGSENTDKKQRRELRAHYIWEQVDAAYRQFPKGEHTS